MDSSYKPAMEFGGAAPTIASSSLASYSSSTSTSLPFVPGNLVDTKAGNIGILQKYTHRRMGFTNLYGRAHNLKSVKITFWPTSGWLVELRLNTNKYILYTVKYNVGTTTYFTDKGRLPHRRLEFVTQVQG